MQDSLHASHLKLPVSNVKTGRDSSQSGHFTRQLLLVVVSVLIILITCSFLTIWFVQSGKSMVIVVDQSVRPDATVQDNHRQQSAQHCPPVECPTPLVPDCPVVTLPKCPQLQCAPCLRTWFDAGFTERNTADTPTTIRPIPNTNQPILPEAQTQPEDDSKAKQILSRITLYSDSFYGGTQFEVSLQGSACFDLPDGFDNVTSSFRIKGKCARLCADHFCKGKCLEMSDADIGSNWFGYIDFNDQVSSLQNCPKLLEAEDSLGAGGEDTTVSPLLYDFLFP